MEEERVDSNVSSGDVNHPPELRILLLGNKAAGKSSSGNTILGKEEFSVKTARCVKRCGEVEGRRVTVVKAPGWWRNYLIKDTPALNTEEIVLGVSLCSPGPHAVLIVVRLDTDFTEINRRAIEERLQLLGTEVWNHAILLFTHGDGLQDTSIEEHIKNKGHALEWVVAKCKKRHVFDNANRRDNKQVIELLQKIADMVAENNSLHFEIDFDILDQIKWRREVEEKNVNERLTAAEKEKQDMSSLTGQTQSELRIVLVGHRYSGKSSAGNTILGRQEFHSFGSFQGLKRQGEVAGRHVTLVEAPGWWNNYLPQDSPQLYQQDFLLSASLCPPGPHVILVVIRADGSFIPINGKAIQEHVEFLNERVWKHTMVLFTYGDWLGDTTIEQHIESEGTALKSLMQKCGNQYHVFNNNDRRNTQVTELLKKVEKMVSRNGYLHYQCDQAFVQRKIEILRMCKAVNKEGKKRDRNSYQVLNGDADLIPELRIVLLGPKYSGKREKKEFAATSFMQCVTRRLEAWRNVTVVETPGWPKAMTAWIKHEIFHGIMSCSPGPHALLLVIQADTSFTEEMKCAAEEYMTVMGDSVWNHTIVVFTHEDGLGDTTIEQHIESEGKALQWLVEACKNRYHVFDNMVKGDETQVKELLEKIEKMVSENGGHFSYSVKALPNMRGITDNTMGISQPYLYSTDAWRLSDVYIRDNQSIHHPPAMSAYDRCLTGSDYNSLVSQSGSSQSGSSASSLSSGIGSLRERRLKAFYKSKTEEDKCSVASKTGKRKLLDEQA